MCRYTTFDNLVGTLQDVWVVEFGKDANYVVGHTSSYVQVLIPREENLLGRRCKVRVDSASKWSVKATLVEVLAEAEALPQVSISRTSVLQSPAQLKASNKPLPGRNLPPSRMTIEEDYGEEDEEDERAGNPAFRRVVLAWAVLVMTVFMLVTVVDPLLSCLGMGVAVLWERVGLKSWRHGTEGDRGGGEEAGCGPKGKGKSGDSCCGGGACGDGVCAS